jgi:hypothetical protein
MFCKVDYFMLLFPCGNNFLNIFVKAMGSCLHSGCRMWILLKTSSLVFFVHHVKEIGTCISMPYVNLFHGALHMTSLITHDNSPHILLRWQIYRKLILVFLNLFKLDNSQCNSPAATLFGRIPVKKDTQTPGGSTRISLKAAAIKRYYITAEYRSSFLGL